MVPSIVLSLIFLFVVGLICWWVSFVVYTENRFFKEQDSIKKWLKTHGFGIEFKRRVMFDTCTIHRLGGRQRYNKVLGFPIYWKLYNIRKASLSRDATVKLINTMIKTHITENREVVEKKKDFWI